MKRSDVLAPTILLMLAGCSTAAGGDRPKSSDSVAGGSMASSQLERTPADAAQYQELFPGASVSVLYGGMDQGVPTLQLGKIGAGVTFPVHSHSNGYHAVVVAGRFQHWEEGDADRGPIMTAGSHYYQPGGNLHYDSCLGPEDCILSVSFPKSADASFPQ